MKFIILRSKQDNTCAVYPDSKDEYPEYDIITRGNDKYVMNSLCFRCNANPNYAGLLLILTLSKEAGSTMGGVRQALNELYENWVNPVINDFKPEVKLAAEIYDLDLNTPEGLEEAKKAAIKLMYNSK